MGKEINAPSATREVMTGINASLGSSGQLLDLASLAVLAGMTFVLTLVLLFYFLLSGPELVEGMVPLIPPDGRPRVRALMREVRPMLFRYVTGVLIIVAYTSVAAWVGIRFILHQPHAEIIALAVGVLELLPVIGPILSGALMAAIAFDRGSHLGVALGFVGFAVALRLSIDQVVGPVVLGRTVILHPVVIIFAFLAGGVLFGMLGVLVAIPAAAIVKLVLEAAHCGPEGGTSSRRGPRVSPFDPAAAVTPSSDSGSSTGGISLYCRAKNASIRRGTIPVGKSPALYFRPGIMTRLPRIIASNPARATSAGSIIPPLNGLVRSTPALAANPVRVGPGHRHVAVTPLPASSLATASVNDSTYDLLAKYAAINGPGT